jgi:hypothetical protein
MKPGDLLRVFDVNGVDAWYCGCAFGLYGKLEKGEPLIFIAAEDDNDQYVVVLSKFGMCSVNTMHIKGQLP